MNTKLETVTLSALLLLLTVLVCPQTVLAQTGSGVQTNSGFPSYLPLNTANTTETNNTETATTQPPAEEIQQNQMPIMIVIIVAAFAAYIAVIAVLSSKKIR